MSVKIWIRICLWTLECACEHLYVSVNIWICLSTFECVCEHVNVSVNSLNVSCEQFECVCEQFGCVSEHLNLSVNIWMCLWTFECVSELYRERGCQWQSLKTEQMDLSRIYFLFYRVDISSSGGRIRHTWPAIYWTCQQNSPKHKNSHQNLHVLSSYVSKSGPNLLLLCCILHIDNFLLDYHVYKWPLLAKQGVNT